MLSTPLQNFLKGFFYFRQIIGLWDHLADKPQTITGVFCYTLIEFGKYAGVNKR